MTCLPNTGSFQFQTRQRASVALVRRAVPDAGDRERVLRSRIMAAVRSKHTRPELAVRSVLHRLGFRFRLHDKNLPGCPDIVLKRYRCVVFVNGCFWHHHPGCRRARLPATNVAFWTPKLLDNRRRDLANAKKLRDAGWRVAVAWECEVMKDLNAVGKKLAKFVGAPLAP